MKVKALREMLQNSDVEELRKLDALLAEIDEVDVKELLPPLRQAITKIANAQLRKRQTVEAAKVAISRYVAELQNTKLQNADFEAVVNRMKKDKAIKIGEAIEIATRFLGEPKVFKSKAEAAKAILKRQIGDKRASDRQTRISEIF